MIEKGRGLVRVGFCGLAGVCPGEGPEEVVDLNSPIKTIVFQHYIAMFIITTKQNKPNTSPFLPDSTIYSFQLQSTLLFYVVF